MTLPETVLITAEQISGLQKIGRQAAWHRRALGILAGNAIESLGMDRDDESYDANCLRSIVGAGTSVEKAIHLITERRAGAALQRLSGKPVGVMTDQREVAS